MRSSCDLSGEPLTADDPLATGRQKRGRSSKYETQSRLTEAVAMRSGQRRVGKLEPYETGA